MDRNARVCGLRRNRCRRDSEDCIAYLIRNSLRLIVHGSNILRVSKGYRWANIIKKHGNDCAQLSGCLAHDRCGQLLVDPSTSLRVFREDDNDDVRDAETLIEDTVDEILTSKEIAIVVPRPDPARPQCRIHRSHEALIIYTGVG
jgi:hypothetical protein